MGLFVLLAPMSIDDTVASKKGDEPILFNDYSSWW